jgi:hypothetical protein
VSFLALSGAVLSLLKTIIGTGAELFGFRSWREHVLRRRRNEVDAFPYAFDLLELDGADLRREPIETREATLASVLRQREHSFGHDGPPLRGSRPSQCRTGRSRPLNALSKKKFPLE